MWFTYALIAAASTSFLPILYKHLLRQASPPVVAWTINALSLPLLLVGTILVSRVPSVDLVFFLGVAASGAVNWLATLASAHALRAGDASLITPLLTFNPPFSLLIAFLVLGESPTGLGIAGVMVIITGAYLFEIERRAGAC